MAPENVAYRQKFAWPCSTASKQPFLNIFRSLHQAENLAHMQISYLSAGAHISFKQLLSFLNNVVQLQAHKQNF